MYRLLSYLILLSTSLLAQTEKMPITSKSKKALELYYQARTLNERLRPLSAQPLLQQALKLDPDFVMAQFELTNTYNQPGPRREATLKLFEMKKTATISSAEQLFVDRLEAGFNGDNKTADARLAELYAKFPNDERVVMQMALFYANKNEISKAIELYERSIKINPDYVTVYNTLGYTYRGQGRNEDAERIFKQAIQIDPKNPNAYDSYAELLLKLGRYEESIKYYEKALEIESIFPSAVMGIASNLLHLKRYEESRERLNKVLSIAPNDGIRGGVHWALSVTYIDEGKFDEAVLEMTNNYNYSKKHKDNQSMSIDLGNISHIYFLKGDFKTAQKYNEESLQTLLRVDFSVDQKETIKKNNLPTQILHDVNLKQMESAWKKWQDFKQFAESQSNFFISRNVHNLKSLILFNENKYAEAIDEMDLGDRWNINNMYRRAIAYEKLGEIEKAKNEFNLIVTSRGALNYDYSVLRHKAIEKLAAL
ncbi:MAG: tetratricopeptide repeat protein [Calditrichaeota bacterium]|nr:tetratricopeptide repeat protein [Calditrichota bacterium]